MKNLKAGVFLVLAAICCSAPSVAQDTLRMSVFYDYNQAVLNTGQTQRLDSLAEAIAGRFADQIRIIGNTDSRGSHDYNQALSEARARSVYDYLSEQNVNGEKLEILAQGKTLPLQPGQNEQALMMNRRVDIEIIIGNDVPENISRVMMSGNLTDTTSVRELSFSKGLRLLIPRGAFHPYMIADANIRILYSTDVDKLSGKGFTTMTNTGEVLASAGMLRLEIRDSSDQELPDSYVFQKAVEVWVPVTPCACLASNVRLWNAVSQETGDITWDSAASQVRIATFGSKQYYVIRLTDQDFVNLDCKVTSEPGLIAIRKYDAVSVKCVYPKAKVITTGRAVAGGKVEIPLLRTKEVPKVYAKVTDSEGQVFSIRGRRLDQFRKDFFSGNYVFRKRDFRKQHPLRLKKVDKDEVIFGSVIY